MDKNKNVSVSRKDWDWMLWPIACMFIVMVMYVCLKGENKIQEEKCNEINVYEQELNNITAELKVFNKQFNEFMININNNQKEILKELKRIEGVK